MDARSLALRALALDRVAATLVSALDAAGVSSLLLKGPAMGQWLYPGGQLRPYSDVDLLVPPAQLPRAERCLENLGCRPVGDPAPHARTWTCPAGAAGFVDLHHSFHYVTVADERCWEVLSQGSVALDLGGQAVQVPPPATLAALLTLHGLRADSSPRCRGDLDRALAAFDDDLWTAAAAVAERLGATEAFGEGLRLTAGGRRLAEQLGLPPLRSPAIALTLAERPRTTAGFGRLFDARTPGALIRRLGAELVPSPAHMRSCYPRLARWQSPVGLTLAYLVRPVFVMVQSPAGFRSWTQVRRSVRHDRGPRPQPRETRVGLCSQILVAYVRGRWRLRRTGLEGVVAQVRRPRPSTALAVDPAAAVAATRRLAIVSGRVLRRLPTDARCLIHSLVVLDLACARSVDATLVIAVQTRPTTVAHAWVEVAGAPVMPAARSAAWVRLAEL